VVLSPAEPAEQYAVAEDIRMGGRGNHDLAASRGLSPADGAAVQVDRLEDLPGALMQLARLVARSGHLRPDTVGRIAAEHARTVLTLSDVLARRHTVAGTTAPALLGVSGELRSHAATLASLRAVVRGLRSAGDDDPGPTRQLREIRRRLRREERRLAGRLTDGDLHAAVASLRPALWVGPALRCAITRQLNAGAWLHPARDGSWQRATTTSVPRVADAALVARESGLRLVGSLATPPPPPARGYAHRSRRHDHTPALHSFSAPIGREADGVRLA
jgi:hypothetical protein